MLDYLIQAVYFISALLFILGLKKFAKPASAKGGLMWAGLGLLISILITYFHHGVQSNYLWMTVAIVLGGVIAYLSNRNVSIDNAPKMVALYTGLGGGAAVAIASLVLLKLLPLTDLTRSLTVIAIFLGCISFVGGLVLFLKLHGFIKKPIRLPMHQWLNALVAVIAITFGVAIVMNGQQFELSSLILLLLFSQALGKFLAFPASDADAPTLLSFFNTLSGLAVASVGFVYSNMPMLIGGILAAVVGWVLTRRITKSRSLAQVLLGDHSESEMELHQADKVAITTINEAAMLLAYAKNVIVVPGYGMALAQAQDTLWQTAKILEAKGTNVKLAIHPAAGRMPGHMNTLLADAGISYDSIFDLDEINHEFSRTDVVLVVGANDVVNSGTRMPILKAEQAKKVIIIKRGTGLGYSATENPLLHGDNVSVLRGDAKTIMTQLVREIKVA